MVARRSRRRTSQRHASRAEDENPLFVDAELARGRFSFIYCDSFQKQLKVKQCFPLIKSRTICQSAIRGLQKAFNVDESGHIGYSYAGGLAIAAKVPEGELELVKTYLLELGKSDDEATAAAFSQGIEWYGIVDGALTHKALLELEGLRPDPFQDFKWAVCVINWQPIAVLKAFARARNLLQSTNVVEMTLYDTILGLHEIAQEKAQLAGDTVECFVKQRGVITQIADEFCGGSKYSRQTTRTLAGAALRIKGAALTVLGQIMTEENASLARRTLERNTAEVVGEEDIFDARVYKNIISTNTIRGATNFLNAGEEDQATALLKLKFSYEENGFKCFQASRLNKEVHRSECARQQIHLMNVLMCRDRWPEELSDIEKKLTASSHFDSELDKYGKNSDTILPSLITEYRQRMPLEAGLRWRLHCAEIERRNAGQPNAGSQQGRQQGRQQTESNDGTGPDLPPGDGGAGEAGGGRGNREEGGPSELCPLKRLNVSCMNLTLERYSLHRKVDDEKFHLVTGDPTQLQINGTCKVSVDDREADKYVGIVKPLVRDHGWVFFYTRAVDYSMWDKAFRANGFDPLDYPWIMVRDTDTIQTNTSPIPQNITELLIGARKKDSGRPGFQPDISSTYKRPVSSRKRKFAIMDCCPEPRMKVKKQHTREPLRSNQRAAEPMAEFLETFCPPGGFVLDAFAGTMETAKACYMTGRKCVVLEADNLCFNLSREKLKDNAIGYLPENGDPSTEETIDLVHATAVDIVGNDDDTEMERQQREGDNDITAGTDDNSEDSEDSEDISIGSAVTEDNEGFQA